MHWGFVRQSAGNNGFRGYTFEFPFPPFVSPLSSLPPRSAPSKAARLPSRVSPHSTMSIVPPERSTRRISAKSFPTGPFHARPRKQSLCLQTAIPAGCFPSFPATDAHSSASTGERFSCSNKSSMRGSTSNAYTTFPSFVPPGMVK